MPLLLLLVTPVACSNDLVMPDLTGMSNDESAEAMEDAGIEDYTVHFVEGPNPLEVIDQDPDPGEPINSESEVLVNLSGN